MKTITISYMIVLQDKRKVGENMKKFLISIGIILIGIPALATCSITGGACTFNNLPSNVTQGSELENLIPNNLQQLQKTDAFQRDYQKPYHDALINTQSSSLPATQEYNSNCQFGVCLPGGELVPGEVVE